jgi:hypothetical protein
VLIARRSLILPKPATSGEKERFGNEGEFLNETTVVSGAEARPKTQWILNSLTFRVTLAITAGAVGFVNCATIVELRVLQNGKVVANLSSFNARTGEGGCGAFTHTFTQEPIGALLLFPGESLELNTIFKGRCVAEGSGKNFGFIGIWENAVGGNIQYLIENQVLNDRSTIATR